MLTNVSLENLKGRDHLEDLGIDWRILEWILENQVERMWTGFMLFRLGTSDGLL
jgi:hypothetical protein